MVAINILNHKTYEAVSSQLTDHPKLAGIINNFSTYLSYCLSVYPDKDPKELVENFMRDNIGIAKERVLHGLERSNKVRQASQEAKNESEELSLLLEEISGLLPTAYSGKYKAIYVAFNEYLPIVFNEFINRKLTFSCQKKEALRNSIADMFTGLKYTTNNDASYKNLPSAHTLSSFKV